MNPTLHLSAPFDHLLEPLFEALPLNRAMPRLVGEGNSEHHDLIQKITADPAVAQRPEVIAGLWLYVDALDRSHTVSQNINTPTGSYWHGIMHRREGDFSNSHYWFRKVGKHPAMREIDIAGGSAGAGTDVGRYDPHAFIDAVEQAHQQGDTGQQHPELLALQRHEWVRLFEWCCEK
jgi:hypothetical protein